MSKENVEKINNGIHRLFLIIAWIAILATIIGLVVIGHWLLRSYSVIEVEQPLIILNEDKIVPIGGTLKIQITYEKTVNANTTIYPTIQCKSGNLVTLTPYDSDLPVGNNTLVSERLQLPPKFKVGDTCQYVQNQSYQVNPVKRQFYEFRSEFFTVGEPIQ